jgi:hypothetical protein
MHRWHARWTWRQDLASAEAKRGMILSMLLPVLLTLTSFIGAPTW